MILPKPIALSEADIVRFWSKVDRRGPNDCWKWTAGRNDRDYGTFHDSDYHKYYAHRIAFAITNGDTDLYVLHRCNHPWCCNPKHLYAGTQKDNIQQCITEGRGFDRCGENHGRAKLTESDVHEIRRLYAGGWFQREIAEEYDISRSQVGSVCRGENWKHVGGTCG